MNFPMGVFLLVLQDDETDSIELLGVFASTKEAVLAVEEMEEVRQTLEVDEDVTFLLGKPRPVEVGIMPVSADAKREYCVLAQEEPAEEHDAFDTDYFVLEF